MRSTSAGFSSGLRTTICAKSGSEPGSPRPNPLPLGEGQHVLRLLIDLAAGGAELLRLLLEPDFDHFLVAEALLAGIFAHVLRDAHAAEVRAAHGAEVGCLGWLGRQRLVVERRGRRRVER